MANPDPSRTEWPTAKRIQKERQKGNILSCNDLNSLAIISAGSLLLFITVPWLADAFRNILDSGLSSDCRIDWTDHEVCSGVVKGVAIVGRILAPVCLGVFLTALLIMRIQVGKFFSMKPLKWKFKVLFNPQAAMKDLIPHKDTVINLGFAASKVFIVGYLIYFTISREFGEILKLNLMPLWPAIKWGVVEVYMLIFKILAIFAVIVVLSYWHRWKKYYDMLRMTKQEVRDERKDADGDPRVKAKIRAKMREVFFRSMTGNIKNADLVVTNPTHVAVALRYNPEKDGAPIVIAKGLRKRALRIKELAKVYGVPVVEAPPLARSLYRTVKIGAFIPSEFYKAVATILARLHREGVKTLQVKKSA